MILLAALGLDLVTGEPALGRGRPTPLDLSASVNQLGVSLRVAGEIRDAMLAVTRYPIRAPQRSSKPSRA